MNVLLLLAVLSVNAAEDIPGGDLADTAHYTRYAAGCVKKVLMGHSPSLPIPVLTLKGLRYALMYYPTSSPDGSSGPDAVAYPPTVIAEFDAEGRDIICRNPPAIRGADFSRPMGPAISAAAKTLSVEEYDKRAAMYYSTLETVGNAYAKRKSDARSQRAALDFRSLFDELSEPGLKEAYRAMSPKFWSWLDGFEKKPER